jgi:hypothetical protein
MAKDRANKCRQIIMIFNVVFSLIRPRCWGDQKTVFSKKRKKLEMKTCTCCNDEFDKFYSNFLALRG